MAKLIFYLLVLTAFAIGAVVGVTHYESQCEIIGYTKPEWRECSL